MEVPQIDVQELARLRGEGATLVDVREQDEYEEVRAPGGILIQLGELPERFHELPEGPLYCICQSGGRSKRATAFLISQGRDATNVAGGTQAWVQAGLPTERGPAG